MKKILTIIAAITVFVIAAVPAFADMDAPPFTEYEAHVIKEGGAWMYDYLWDDETEKDYVSETETLIPFGEKLTVTGEFVFDGEYYGSVDYNDTYGYVLVSDISNELLSYGAENAYMLDNPETTVVINPEGVYLRSGPSMSYDTVSEKIEFGTQLTYELVNDRYDYSWAYINNNGVSGWLNTVQYGMNGVYDCGKLVSENNDIYYNYSGKIITIDDGLQLTKTPEESSGLVSGKIPAGTELTFEWYYIYPKRIAAYVEYDGIKGWLVTDDGWHSSSAIGYKNEFYVYSTEDKIPLYDFPDGKKTGEYIMSGDIASDVYTVTREIEDSESYKYIDWRRVTVNGKTGWVCQEDESNIALSGIEIHPEGRIYLFEDMPIYSEMGNILSKTQTVIPKNSDCLCVKSVNIYMYDSEREETGIDDYWYYVDFNGNAGWIVYDCLSNSDGKSVLSVNLYNGDNIRYISNATVYESYSAESPVIAQITEDTAIREIYDYYESYNGDIVDGTSYCYIENDVIKGWVSEEELLHEYNFRDVLDERRADDTLTEEEKFDVNTKYIYSLDKKLKEAEKTAKIQAEEPASASPDTIIIGCIAGAVILGLTAVVTVILVNKKKKSAE